MKTYEWIAPCHFGMEAVLKKRYRTWAMRSVRLRTEE